MEQQLRKWASALALITIFYNLAEGMVSVFFGFEDGTIALFGFGVDSFVEVISGIGIWHMVKRMRREGVGNRDAFEKTALRITGTAFYILSAGMVITASVNIYQGYKPETTLWGIIVSVISIFCMWVLIHFKVKVGKELNSESILADANCSRVCMWLSVILLLSSAGYELTGIGLMDSLGAAGIAYLSFSEGREAFWKSKGYSQCNCQNGCH